MGTIRSTFQNVTFKVSEGLDNIVSGAQTLFDNIVGDFTSNLEGLFSGDVVGIDENQIDTMKQAIDDYVDALNEHLDTMESNATTSEAYKGSYAEAVTEFVAAVKTCCYAVVSQLLAFRDQLTAIGEKYAENDTALKTDISTQAEELSGSYEAYDNSGN